MKVSLPEGAWVELRDPSTIRNRDRRLAVLHMEAAGEGLARGYANSYGVLALVIDSWSFDLPVPSLAADGAGVRADVDSLDELTPTEFDLLAEAARPCRDAIFPDVTSAGSGPTEPSNG